MDYFSPIDSKIITAGIALFILGIMIGRITKRIKSGKNYNQTLASLNQKVQSAAEKSSKYESYHFTLRNLCKLFVVLYCALGYFAYYLRLEVVVNYPEYFGYIALTLFISVYGLSYGCKIISQDYVHRQEMYKQQITSSKSEIIRDLGPEVIEILQGTMCNKKCKENTEVLSKSLRKHQELIQKFSKFQWCDACSQAKKCTGMCGSYFWNYTKEAMKEFRTAL